MYLSRIHVKNYRSIKSIDVRFKQGKNVIVGRNNSGKSNIVKAIDIVLGESSPTWKSENITDNDFHNGDTSKMMLIWCELSRNINPTTGEIESIDFSNPPQQAFKKVVKEDNSLPFRERVASAYYLDFSNNFEGALAKAYSLLEEKAEVEIFESNHDYFSTQWIGEKGYCRGRSFENEFENVQKFALGFFAMKNSDGEIEKTLGLFFTKDGANWEMGLNAGGLRHLLIQSAIIPAFRDTKDQLRINSWSWYGKLLKHYIDSENPDLKTAFDGVKKASNTVFEELQEKVEKSTVTIAFPETKISFQFNPDTKQDVYKSALIYVDDGFNSELKDKGSGIQSAVTIGLFDFYIREVAHSCGSLLAIEEPELYLHPHGRRVISDRLNHFLDGGKNQVITTTHSSEFIVPVGESLNIIAVNKQKDGTQAQNIDFSPVKRKQILVRKEAAELFFADLVILTEDAKYFLEAVAKKVGAEIEGLGKNWLNEKNISIINVGGKGNFWKYVEVLKELGIKHYVVPDFDFLRNGLSEYFSHLSEPQTKADILNKLKSEVPLGGLKSILEITKEDDRKKVENYTLDLFSNENIFLLSGELESYYHAGAIPPFSKEQGVLITMEQMLEDGRKIEDFIDTHDFENFLRSLVSSQFPPKTQEERALESF